MAGSVVGEQTQLSFSPAPPAASCSSRLPAFLCEGRGGETGFAMNQKTQLQFNLESAPNQANLATKFEPSRQSPVVIEKMPEETIGVSQTPADNFRLASAERLSLALKLAKRDARRKTVTLGSEGPCSDCRCCDECEQVPPSGYPETLEHHLKSCIIKSHADSSKKSSSDNPRNKSSKNPSIQPARLVPKPPQVAIVEEIEKLKVDLEKQLKLLTKAKKAKLTDVSPQLEEYEQEGLKRLNKAKKLKLAESKEVSIYREPMHWNEEDETKERQKQREEAQMMRNTRMLYDLTQQVGLDVVTVVNHIIHSC